MFLYKRKTPNKAIKTLLATNAAILFAAAMLGPIYALFVEEIGGNLLDASLAGGVFALAAGLTSLLSGRFSDKIKESRLIVVVGYALIGVGFVLYLVVSSMWSLLLIQAIIGLGEAIYSPAFDALYSSNLDKHKFALEWGMWETVNYFTAAIGAVAGGLLVTYLGFKILFVTMAFMCFGSALYILFLPKKTL